MLTSEGPDPLAEAMALAPAKRALIANMRHDLRTPINAIIGYSEILLEEAEARGLTNVVADLRRIHSAGQRLLVLIGEILDPARIEAAKVDVTAPSFGAHVRHELRTPLNAVIGYSELLLENPEDLGEELVSDLRRVHIAGQRLIDLLDDVIRLTRIEAGTGGFEALTDSTLARDVVAAVRSLTAETAYSARVERGSLLVVDDNEMNRDMLCRQLERHGHEVVAAGDGGRALELMAERAFDLVLLDILMPGMNGYEVLLRMKGDDRLCHVPVIMISALDEVDSVVRCIEAGAEDYLPKPFSPVLLKARIGSSLERKRLRDREQAHLDQLCREREKSERLLLNVLPPPIAERLKQGECPIADSFGEASVLFADLVGFTQLAAELPANELVSLLNEIFTAFDGLADRHGLEKIKTIGDAYMAAAGLPTPRPDHAEAAVAMALDMLSVVGKMPGFSIRIGINCGPVVAGVIGRNKFAYDLWGDTVNTASRMESHGIPSCVTVTEAVYSRLSDKYRFEERGGVQVKNKGAMKVYLLRET